MARSSISDLDDLADRIRACRVCRDAAFPALPHEPRPVFRLSTTAKLLIASQAPGIRAHVAERPFSDPSGVRLRQWMDIGDNDFYDVTKVAIVPMGFCFPGHDANKGDLPPRRECRAIWHDQLFEVLPAIETILAIGRYAQDYHFARIGRPLPRNFKLDDVVRQSIQGCGGPTIIALPHPSWRNNSWLKRNPWFETDVLPVLRRAVRTAIG